MSARRPIARRFSLAALVLLAGCAPSVTPLYRDYAAPMAAPPTTATADARSLDRLREALVEAGWTVLPASDAPAVVSTAPRGFGDWGLYRVEAHLDVVPVGDRHVRVLVHPVRRYVTGSASKIGFLTRGLRGRVLGTLDAALSRRGLRPLSAPIERDTEAVAGT